MSQPKAARLLRERERLTIRVRELSETLRLAQERLEEVNIGLGALGNWGLLEAAEAGDAPGLRALLCEPPDRLRKSQAKLALFAAVDLGGDAGARCIEALQGHADFEALGPASGSGARGKNMESALMRACLLGDAPCVEALLACGANPFTSAPDGSTAMMYAAVNESFDLARILVKAEFMMQRRDPSLKSAYEIEVATLEGVMRHPGQRDGLSHLEEFRQFALAMEEQVELGERLPAARKRARAPGL